MGRIFCLSIEGKKDQSEFMLDLIKSRGFEDQIFEILFRSIYDEGNVESFERALIDAVNKENKNTTLIKDYSMTARVNKILHLFK